jgi:hypothetical protein
MRITPRFVLPLLLATACTGTVAQTKPPAPECRAQQVEQSKVEICLVHGAAFQHDHYMLRADGAVIFMLPDDFAEKVELEHILAEGPSIEYPLSRQGEKSVKIVGGCVPESKDGAEVARICNFRWGKYQVVKDQRFEFK